MKILGDEQNVKKGGSDPTVHYNLFILKLNKCYLICGNFNERNFP